MKKLTWALLSLMLFLGLGVASAQEVTVPKPALDPDPSSGTITPGQNITPLGEDECMEFLKAGKMIYALYVWDDAATELKVTEDLNQTMAGEGEAAYKVAMWFSSWYSYIEAPETAGDHTLRARLVAIPNPYGGLSAQAKAGDFDDSEYIYGEEITADYTVAGEAVVETLTAPTLSPATGAAVSYGGRVNINMAEAYEDDFGSKYGILYVKNDASFDFSGYTSVAAAKEAGAEDLDNPYVKNITESQTITVAVYELKMTGDIAAWSDPVTGTYTVPAAPSFNPNGGTVALDDKIELTTGTTGGKIYYGQDATAFAKIKTSDELDASMALQLYDADDKFALEDLGAEGGETLAVVAATAMINTDGSVAWSNVISKNFTAKEDETPGDEVAQPTITPNDAHVKVGDKVAITCKTGDATIYYTIDGTEPSASSTRYTEPFEITMAMVPNDGELKIRAIAIKDDKSASARTTLVICPNDPTFEPEAGAVDFGTMVELDCNLSKATIYFTTDGTAPTEESEEYSFFSEILISKAMTVKAIAVFGQCTTDPVEAAYTVKTPNAQLKLEPMQDDTVGKNVATGISFNDPENPASAGWLQKVPASVYYTTDGTTAPSKEAYDAQTDKENGAIKMIAVKWEDQDGWYGPVQDAEGNLLALTFTEPTHLKAIGYLMDGEEVLVTTALLDTMLQVKAEVNPEFELRADDMLVQGTEVTVGDKLIVKNPNPLPEMPDEDATEEEWKAYDDMVAAIPYTTLYFSFDGTEPTAAGYDSQEADYELDRPYDTYKIFKAEQVDIVVTFGKDEKGFYGVVPVIGEVLNQGNKYDTIRLVDGKFPMEVFAVTALPSEGGNPGGPGGWEPLSATPKWGMPGGAKPFQYGSDFVKVEYTAFDWELPATVTAPVFVPAPEAGSLAQGEAIKWTMDASYEKYSRHGGVSAVAYVINGTDADLNIDADKLGDLVEASDPDGATVREDGKVYLYEGEATAFELEKTCSVKACQVVAIVVEGEDGESTVQIKLSEIVTANYTVDASKLQKPTIKTPIAGSTVEPNSPITFEVPNRYDWSAYTNMAYILYVENDAEVKLEGTAADIMNAVPQTPAAGAKAGEPAYKVVNCHKNGDDLNWTEALIATQEGALTIRARLAGINDDDEVFYSDEVTVSCTVAKGEPVDPGIDDPQLPETVKAPTFVPAAGEVEKGQAITWTWDEAYNDETYPLIAVAYVVDGEDSDLDITIENFGELWEASLEEDETTVREEGVTYLYRTDVDDAYPYHIEKACTVKARMLLGVLNNETGEPAIKLSPIVEAAYTIKGEPLTPPDDPNDPVDPEVKVAKPTFDPVAGAVKRGTKVTVSCETEDAVIYYTLDGTEPTDKSEKYEAAIEINEAMTVKAIAIKGDAKSEVAEAAYTIDLTANEELELAGVTVYPNPSNGLFNIELPVAATVEVFMSNGMLYQRMKLGEGRATLNIERSGIYFLRITGEGRTTVKRIIVR